MFNEISPSSITYTLENTKAFLLQVFSNIRVCGNHGKPPITAVTREEPPTLSANSTMIKCRLVSCNIIIHIFRTTTVPGVNVASRSLPCEGFLVAICRLCLPTRLVFWPCNNVRNTKFKVHTQKVSALTRWGGSLDVPKIRWLSTDIVKDSWCLFASLAGD